MKCARNDDASPPSGDPSRKMYANSSILGDSDSDNTKNAEMDAAILQSMVNGNARKTFWAALDNLKPDSLTEWSTANDVIPLYTLWATLAFRICPAIKLCRERGWLRLDRNLLRPVMLQTRLQSRFFLGKAETRDFFNHILRTVGNERGDRSRQWLEFFNHNFFLAPPVQTHRATELSWEVQYEGDAAICLFEYMRNHFNTNQDTYVPYLSIIQSSGMGKSRTVDELSKNHFVIPICLREDDVLGFPPPDTEVRDFFTEEFDPMNSKARSHAFLVALGQQVNQWLESNFQNKKASRNEIASAFRQYMTLGMTSSTHNQNRVGFYQNVVDRAVQLLDASRPNLPKYLPALAIDEPMEIDSAPLKISATSLSRPCTPPEYGTSREIVKRQSSRVKFERESSEVTKDLLATETQADVVLHDLVIKMAMISEEEYSTFGYEPFLILALDDSQVLAEFLDKDQNGIISRLSMLRRVLINVRSESLFSLFLFTPENIFPSTMPQRYYPSSRVLMASLIRIPPFSDLGFDMFAIPIKLGVTTLEFIAQIEYMVSLGRALFFTRFNQGSEVVQKNILQFAAEKLLGQLLSDAVEKGLSRGQTFACLSVRLALDFQSPNPNPHTQLDQIENHMRVCLQVDEILGEVKSVAASEPVLAEAAASIMMSNDFDPVEALTSEFRCRDIKKGSRGELLVALMQLITRDHIVAKLNKDANKEFLFTNDCIRVIPVVEYLQTFFKDSNVVLNAMPSCTHPCLPDKLRQSTDSSEPGPAMLFADMFQNSRCYFTHFLKINDPSQMSRESLFQLALRGVSIICADGMDGIDLITPFLFWDTTLNLWNVSVILWQCTSDGSYGANPEDYHFDLMDPYKLGIFKRESNPAAVPEQAPLPVIRIVTALTAAKSSEGERPDSGLVNFTNWKHKDASDRVYTSYDFWAYGFDESLYAALGMRIRKKTRSSPGQVPDLEPSHHWHSLLDSSIKNTTTFKARPYEPKKTLKARRSQYPGGYIDDDHYAYARYQKDGIPIDKSLFDDSH